MKPAKLWMDSESFNIERAMSEALEQLDADFTDGRYSAVSKEKYAQLTARFLSRRSAEPVREAFKKVVGRMGAKLRELERTRKAPEAKPLKKAASAPAVSSEFKLADAVASIQTKVRNDISAADARIESLLRKKPSRVSKRELGDVAELILGIHDGVTRELAKWDRDGLLMPSEVSERMAADVRALLIKLDRLRSRAAGLIRVRASARAPGEGGAGCA